MNFPATQKRLRISRRFRVTEFLLYMGTEKV